MKQSCARARLPGFLFLVPLRRSETQSLNNVTTMVLLPHTAGIAKVSLSRSANPAIIRVGRFENAVMQRYVLCDS
jgi:hypothetical protein